MLTSQEPAQVQHDLDLIWHKQVLLKVFIFAWQFRRDRLPTKSNLAIRGVISNDTCLCVVGYGQVEDTRHLFLSISFFGSIWPLLRSWIGFDGANNQDITYHFTHFTFSIWALKSQRSFQQLV